ARRRSPSDRVFAGQRQGEDRERDGERGRLRPLQVLARRLSAGPLSVTADPLERAIADACLGRQTDEALAAGLRGFLEARGVAADDVDAILQAPPRLAVYRTLVRNGLARVVVRMLPRTRARMNATRGNRFDPNLARFPDEAAPAPPHRRDVPRERSAWAERAWRKDASVPAYLPDLAAHELEGFAVAAAEDGDDMGPIGDIALDRSVAMSASARPVRYAWAVHDLDAREDATDEPSRRDVRLLAYRDAEHAVRWLELTPLAASIVDRLLAGQALGGAIADACAENGTAPPAVATDVARLLAELGERGVLLGGRPPQISRPPSATSAKARIRATSSSNTSSGGTFSSRSRTLGTGPVRASTRARSDSTGSGTGAPCVSMIMAPGVSGATASPSPVAPASNHSWPATWSCTTRSRGAARSQASGSTPKFWQFT